MRQQLRTKVDDARAREEANSHNGQRQERKACVASPEAIFHEVRLLDALDGMDLRRITAELREQRVRQRVVASQTPRIYREVGEQNTAGEKCNDEHEF